MGKVTAEGIQNAILDLPFANTAPIEWDDADWHIVRRALAPSQGPASFARVWNDETKTFDHPIGTGLPPLSARTNNHAELVEALREGETLETIIAWGDQTFGPCSQERAIERAGEEWTEMEEDGADVPIEAADVIICLLRIPGILDAINRKMTINRGRTWDVRPDGTGYHVKSAALSLYGGEKP